MAEGFFHDDAARAPVAIELGFCQTLGQGLDHTGRHRHVKDAVGLEAPLVILLRKLVGNGGKGFGLAEVGLHVGEMFAEGFPLLLAAPAAPREVVDAFVQVFDKTLAAHFGPVQSQNPEPLRQPVIQKKVVECRHELAPGQITGTTEDHEDAGIGTGFFLHGASSENVVMNTISDYCNVI